MAAAATGRRVVFLTKHFFVLGIAALLSLSALSTASAAPAKKSVKAAVAHKSASAPAAR